MNDYEGYSIDTNGSNRGSILVISIVFLILSTFIIIANYHLIRQDGYDEGFRDGEDSVDWLMPVAVMTQIGGMTMNESFYKEYWFSFLQSNYSGETNVANRTYIHASIVVEADPSGGGLNATLIVGVDYHFKMNYSWHSKILVLDAIVFKYRDYDDYHNVREEQYFPQHGFYSITTHHICTIYLFGYIDVLDAPVLTPNIIAAAFIGKGQV